MAEYGYCYRSFSTYSTVRNEPRVPVTKPFSPFVPNTNNGNSVSSDGYVTKKKIVPVTSGRPSYDDDYNSHSSPPSRGDDHEWHPQTSPVRGSPRKVDEFPTKVQSEASRPQRSSPAASADWRHAPQPAPYSAGDYGSNKEGRKPIGGTINHDGYNGTDGYGDYGSNNKGQRKPIGSTIRNDNYDGTNGYGGDYGSSKEGGKPIGGTTRNDGYNNYNGTNNGYGDYGGNKEGHKPIGSTIRNDNHDGTNGYGDYGSNRGRKPIGSAIRNDNHDGTNGYGDYGSNKDGRKPIGGAIRNDNRDGYNYNGTNGFGDKEEHKPIGSPIKNDNYDGPNGYGGYGDYNKNEGYKPTSPPVRNGNYDGYNNGYGTGNGNDKEQRRPYGSTTRNDNYDDSDNYGNHNTKPTGGASDWTRPKISSGWTAAPRKGTQLSEPTHDIEKALELLKMEAAAKHEHSNNYDRPKPNPSANWAAPPAGNGSRLGDLTSKFDKGLDLVTEAERLKNIVTHSPQSRSSSTPTEPATSNKDNYGDRRGTTSTRLLPSRARPSTGVTVIDGRRYGHASVMDSSEAEKRFKGTRVGY